MKKPIIYDDHTDPSKTELHYYIDTRLGKKTCKAMCEFCWLKRDHLSEHVEEPEVALQRIRGLAKKGYTVIPMVSDSFAENGKYLKTELFYKNDEWYFENAAWSSGRPLLQDNHEELLDLCVKNKIDTIIMTSHGTENKEKDFKGLTQPTVVIDAIKNIRNFEKKRDYSFKIILTFTLSRENMSEKSVKSYFDHCEKLGVDVIRFNRFADVQGIYPELRMTKEDTIQSYKTMKKVYEEHPGSVQLSVSEDFGNWGVEVMGFPEGVGNCVAGERLFGVVYPNVYVCPVNLTLKVGEIDENYNIIWDQSVIDSLLKAKKHPDFGGCIGVAYPHFEEIRDYFDDLVKHGESSIKKVEEL
ncbi:radical SAM protein [Xanthovirga aplysinae]|uniref:radical SAM protein n=1 Tax=Xanthovirga aplysinae TaxID=2529853 RepID=UPI0012BC89B0|nr:radical SAM protein [Xanthovirga aplysinae]MTI30034.1 radical SAM protein [Xanthovirga aplysinae]